MLATWSKNFDIYNDCYMNNVLRINKSKTVSLNQELAINLVNHVNLQTDNRLLKFNNQVYMF